MNGKKISIGVAIAFAVVCAIGGAIWWRTHAPDSSASTSASPSSGAAFDLATTTEPGLAAPAPAGWLTYQDPQYHFQIAYPPELTLQKFDDGQGTETFVFQNSDPNNAEGFQVFVVPYAGSQITEQRFKKDEPSGVRNGVQDGFVDGISAVTFYSTDERLEDTAEVWFINDGFLYEVTTLKPLAPWLANIMQTWQFI